MENSFSESENEENTDFKDDPLRRFIEVYESLPELWNCSHGSYKNRTKRNSALDKLVSCYELVKPGAKREDVKRKINSLRTNFRKELKKIISSKRSGAGSNQVYQPQSWKFQALQFLRGCEQPVPVAKEMTKNESYQPEPNDQQPPTSTPPVDSPPARISRSSLDPAPPVPTKRQRTVGPAARQNQLLELACNYLNNEQLQSQAQSDRTPAIAKAWGEKLLTLDETQRIYAEKAINDVLFEASFGNLDRNSVSITIKQTRNEPSSSYRYSPSPPKDTPYNDIELFGEGMNARVSDTVIEVKQDRFPCRDETQKRREANGTAEEFSTGVAEDNFKNTESRAEAVDDIDFFDPADMYAMFAESQHGNITKQELISQSKNNRTEHSTSSAGTGETGEVAVDAPTLHETAYGDADTVHPEVSEDPTRTVKVSVNIHGGYEITEITENTTTYQQPEVLEDSTRTGTVPANIPGEYEITEITENNATYQQPIMLLLPNPYIMSGQNEYIIVPPDYQPIENQEMESSNQSVSINDQSLTTYFQNFTE